MVEIYEPRDLIRQTIGTSRYEIGLGDIYVISIENDAGDTIHVPLLKPTEVYKMNPPELPYVEMKIMTSPATTMNVGGDIHKTDVFLDFDIVWIPREDVIDDTFGKDVASEILDKIMENRSSIGMFIEVVNDGREYYEPDGGRGIVFHHIIELKTNKMQKK